MFARALKMCSVYFSGLDKKRKGFDTIPDQPVNMVECFLMRIEQTKGEATE